MVKNGTVPQFLYIYIPNEHTGGTNASNFGFDAKGNPIQPTALQQVEDGDVGLGMVVEHILKSPIYYDPQTDTGAAIFITEDDAQSSFDHIHPHRTPLVVVSPFAKPGYVATKHYSTAWAKYVVDGDLSYQIDAREIPEDWSTGYVPLGRSSPYQPPPQPFNSNGVQQVYQLNCSLVDWAFQLTQNTMLPDDSTLQQVRAGYPIYPNALKPPFVLEGDDLAADTFWLGDLLNTWAENWISYWTMNKGSFAMGDFEDAGVLQALQFLSNAGRADQNRVLVLRSGSDYTIQPQGQTPAQFLDSENSGGLSGYQEALNDVYQVGSIVVKKLSTNWDTYENQVPEIHQ